MNAIYKALVCIWLAAAVFGMLYAARRLALGIFYLIWRRIRHPSLVLEPIFVALPKRILICLCRLGVNEYLALLVFYVATIYFWLIAMPMSVKILCSILSFFITFFILPVGWAKHREEINRLEQFTRRDFDRNCKYLLRKRKRRK